MMSRIFNSKKICFVITDAISFNILCKKQFEFFHQNADLELTLVCGGTEDELRKLRARNIGVVKNLCFVRRPSLFADLMSFLRLFIFFLFNKFDLVVYSTPKAFMLASLASYLTLQKSRIAIIRGRVYENFSGISRWFWLMLDWISCFLSHKVIFISDSLRDAYIADGLISSKKAFVIGAGSSNGVDIEKFFPRLETSQTARKIQNIIFYKDDFVVSTIGRLCIDKGVEHLHDVISIVKNSNVKFLIVGQVEDAKSSEIIKKLISDFNNVVYLNHTDDISSVYSVTDIHLFLSHREGFGNVAIEAAASGVPTVCFDVVGVRDSVKNGLSGVRFPFGNTIAIANFIDEYSSNKIKYSEKFSGARNWAVVNFNQKIVWENYLRFYLSNI